MFNIANFHKKCCLCNQLTINYHLLFQGLDQIPSRSVGYILRILGQNPTEDDIVEMVMKVCIITTLLCITASKYFLIAGPGNGCVFLKTEKIFNWNVVFLKREKYTPVLFWFVPVAQPPFSQWTDKPKWILRNITKQIVLTANSSEQWEPMRIFDFSVKKRGSVSPTLYLFPHSLHLDILKLRNVCFPIV